jgi:hypothetical protein
MLWATAFGYTGRVCQAGQTLHFPAGARSFLSMAVFGTGTTAREARVYPFRIVTIGRLRSLAIELVIKQIRPH